MATIIRFQIAVTFPVLPESMEHWYAGRLLRLFLLLIFYIRAIFAM